MKFFFIVAIIILSYFFNQIQAQIPKDGLVAYYPFKGNANDCSGNGNNGVVYGATLTTDRCGNLNSAYYFNSTYITLKPVSNFIGYNNYSVCLWVMPTEASTSSCDGTIIYGIGSSSESWEQALTYKNDNSLYAGSHNTNEGQNGSISCCYEPNKWYFIVVTRDDKYCNLYINGKLISPQTSSLLNGAIAYYGSSPWSANIGGRSNLSSCKYFTGKIDDFMFYNRALDSVEVRKLYYTSCNSSLNIQINGDTTVCKGQKNVKYWVSNNNQTYKYTWNYSGSGSVITGSTDTISVDFSDNASSGILSVTASNTSETLSSSLKISIISVPSQPSAISGENKICINSSSNIFSVTSQSDASSYNWIYSGSGATIGGNANSVNVIFSNSATDGVLTVSAQNSCGISDTSDAFPITLKHLPDDAGDIIGTDNVCLNQGRVLYYVPVIANADKYIWDYSGTGTTILGNLDSVYLYFFNNATSGNLTVYGENSCGEGAISNKFPIIASSCSEYYESIINIPNAFTPNGDGINDYFVIKGLVENTKVQIFNRLGKLLYSSDNYLNNWDGRDNGGNIMETATYWYIITVPGMPTEFKGFVYLKK